VLFRSPEGAGYLSGITAVTARRRGAFALASDGTVWAWGSNWAGGVGDNTTTDRYAPVRVLGPGGIGYLSNITAVAGGGNDYATLALKDDGTVWAWGRNYYGQLGDNTTSNSLIPVQVLGPDGIGYLSNITAIDTSGYHSIALKGDGTVWAWGANYYGQLGDNTTSNRLIPVQVLGPGGIGYLSNITAIAAGYNHNLALSSDGTLWAWGQNYYGQLGDNTTADSPVPVEVTGPDGAGYITNITAIAAGNTHSVAVRDDGTLWAWGWNYYGELGDGTNTDRPAPVQALWLENVTSVTAGQGYTLALVGPVPQSAFKAMLGVSPSAKTTAPSTNESFTLSITTPSHCLTTSRSPARGTVPSPRTLSQQTRTRGDSSRQR
jgi:alpha-tubulin suppressor-like RCC1 family protein